MKKITKKQAVVIQAWGDEICKNGKKIDDSFDDGADWESLFVGFAIGRGLSIKEATNYDLYINHAFPLET